ncbi:hypothetical protein HWV62_37404 [Athelia sp. TMB]|nr:hypothetical protein HWV62_37404 [Athelia sp. TMB]
MYPRKEPKPTGRPAHHLNDTQTLFTNPWESAGGVIEQGIFKGMWAMAGEWKSKPLPPKEEYVRVEAPIWALDPSPETWAGDIKATWLGHACFLVEFPAPPTSATTAGADIGAPARGPRVLFDPVFSHRCGPTQWLGPARLTPPPLPLKELPHVDVVILSHNHYDHTDTATLKHIYASQPKGSVHFFTPLGNLAYFKSCGFDPVHVTELDWWDARDATVSIPANEGQGETSTLTITCTPAQHFSGRGLHDRMRTLWASWAIEQRPFSASSSPPPADAKPISTVWFGGDTGLRAVPRGAAEDAQPVCPVFAQLGERFGGFDLALIPIGAFSPRGAFSAIHASPADAVLIHRAIRSRRSIGMHWGCWALGDELFMADPQRLREACEAAGLQKGGEGEGEGEGEFVTVYVGETVRQTPA